MKVEDNTNEKILALYCIRTLATTSKSSNNKPPTTGLASEGYN